jgi:hypothetical protein
MNDESQKVGLDRVGFDINIPEIHHTTGTKVPPALLLLTRCLRTTNRFTKHLRLPNQLFNISIMPKYAPYAETRGFWNPTIIALPSWAKNQYLIVSMVLEGPGIQTERAL